MTREIIGTMTFNLCSVGQGDHFRIGATTTSTSTAATMSTTPTASAALVTLATLSTCHLVDIASDAVGVHLWRVFLIRCVPKESNGLIAHDSHQHP